MSIELIAEAGVAHGGDVYEALRLADAAKEAGADVVKFQTFIPELLLGHREDYGELGRLALKFDDFNRIFRHCENIGIEFMSTPGDLNSLRFLLSLGVRRIKIGSDDLTYAPLIRAAHESGKPVLLSTGMATLAEVRTALPLEWLPKSWTLLHCVSLYPCPLEAANLRAIETLRRHFNRGAGYSDHVSGRLAALGAAALGAVVIEKHFKRRLGPMGPDDLVSIDDRELGVLVEELRQIDCMLGSGVKVPADAEIPQRALLRKGADGYRRTG